MIEIKEYSSNAKAKESIEHIAHRTNEAVRSAMFKLGKDLREEAKRLITEPPKTGRIYRIKRGNKIFIHQASAAGEAPANMTGALRATVNYNVSGSHQIEFGAGNQNKVKYAKYLELGTKKMEKRPYLKPAINSQEGNAFEHFKTEITLKLSE